MKNIYVIILLVLIFSACKKTETRWNYLIPPADTLRTDYKIIADTISYGVVIENRDSTDIWREKWLSHLKKDSLVDRIFKAVYNRELTAYDYFTEEPLSIKDIKKLEDTEEFNRSLIGKIQFEEIWYFDPKELSMVKSVKSIMMAYEVYRQDSTFRGYKPAFKVYLKQPFKNISQP